MITLTFILTLDVLAIFWMCRHLNGEIEKIKKELKRLEQEPADNQTASDKY